jgi:hypothetical protein
VSTRERPCLRPTILQHPVLARHLNKPLSQNAGCVAQLLNTRALRLAGVCRPYTIETRHRCLFLLFVTLASRQWHAWSSPHCTTRSYSYCLVEPLSKWERGQTRWPEPLSLTSQRSRPLGNRQSPHYYTWSRRKLLRRRQTMRYGILGPNVKGIPFSFGHIF